MPTPLSLALEKTLVFRKKNLIPVDDLSESSPCSAPDLFSNHYLSLDTNPKIRQNFLDKLSRSPTVFGSGGARLMSGNTPAVVALEAKLKEFYQVPAALLCNSGFDANICFFHSIPQSGDAVIFDEYLHASARDGLAASRTKPAQYAFAHNSISSLRDCIITVLKNHPNISAGRGTVFIAVESLYSMDSDFAPLPQIVELVDELIPKGCSHIFVDEAHTTGICGPKGRGLVSLLGLEDKVDTILHVFSKGVGVIGALLTTSHLIKTFIIHYGHPHIYTTSLTHADIMAIETSFEYISSPAGAELRDRLQRLSKYFARQLSRALEHIPSSLLALPAVKKHPVFVEKFGFVSPIHLILTPATLSLQNYLRSIGYAARAIPYPVVPKGQERIRVCVNAGNTEKDLDDLIASLLYWAKTAQSAQLAVTPSMDTQFRSRL